MQGTSGDTGSAAIHGVLNCGAVDIVVLYPKGRTTLIQELQMITVDAPNVYVIGVDGTSDDLDVPIRNVFLDIPYCERHHVMSANSINVARILIQTGGHTL
jgi:threonine synthase